MAHHEPRQRTAAVSNPGRAIEAFQGVVYPPNDPRSRGYCPPDPGPTIESPETVLLAEIKKAEAVRAVDPRVLQLEKLPDEDLCAEAVRRGITPLDPDDPKFTRADLIAAMIQKV